MEIRVLEYFLAIAREETISGAAKALHITQPTLSRQMRDLEDEIGKQLFIRSNKKITLTDEGILLRQRAEEIVSLINKTEQELITMDSVLSGSIYIGSGECQTLRIITNAMKEMQKLHPGVKFNIHSGNGPDIIEKIDNGLIDFGMITKHPKISNYNHLEMPIKHHWGLLMLKDDPLAKLKTISFNDIKDKPLIISKETSENSKLVEWFNNDIDHLNIISKYSLLFNATLMVEDGLGYAVCFDNLVNTTGNSNLCFRALEASPEVTYYFIWKKYQVLNKASQCFLDIVKKIVDEYSN